MIVRTNPQGGAGVDLNTASSALPALFDVIEVSESCFELRSGSNLIAIVDLQFTDEEGNDITVADRQACNSIYFSYEGSPAEHLGYCRAVQRVVEKLGWVVEDPADGEVYDADAFDVDISMTSGAKPVKVKPIEDFEPYSPPEEPERKPWWKFW